MHEVNRDNFFDVITIRLSFKSAANMATISLGLIALKYSVRFLCRRSYLELF